MKTGFSYNFTDPELQEALHDGKYIRSEEDERWIKWSHRDQVFVLKDAGMYWGIDYRKVMIEKWEIKP